MAQMRASQLIAVALLGAALLAGGLRGTVRSWLNQI